MVISGTHYPIGLKNTSYSIFDTNGTKWDSLLNSIYDRNSKPFSKNTNQYKDAEHHSTLREGSLTPISNQLNLVTSTVNNISTYDLDGFKQSWMDFSQFNRDSDFTGVTIGQKRTFSKNTNENRDSGEHVRKYRYGSLTPISNQLPQGLTFSNYDTVIAKAAGTIYYHLDEVYNGMTTTNSNITGVLSRFENNPFSETKKYSETRLSNFIGINSDKNRYDVFAYTGTVSGISNPKEKYDNIYRNIKLGGQLLQGGLAQASGLISTNLGLSINTSNISSAINSQGSYESLNYDQLYITPGLGHQDFRNFKTSGIGRLDGTTSAAISLATGKLSAASTKLISFNAAAIASAQLMNHSGQKGHLRTGGTYNFFNQETYFGMGTQDAPGVLRNDFTAGSEATKVWKTDGEGGWKTPKALNAFPFRGDKVTVRDFVQNSYDEIYNWRSSEWQPKSNEKSDSNKGFARAVTAIKNTIGKLRNNNTKDFVKFYLTGKDVYPGDDGGIDDIFVFRANITSLNDSFQPQWTPITALGRADTNWLYSSFQRSIDLGFSVYATSRDEMRPMWRKLNYLSTYTMPEYDTEHPTYRGKYLRITIGDLFISQPVFITSLTYTLANQETTWEINIEEDINIKQVPQMVDVQMGLQFIGNQLPRYQGQAYSLHTDGQYKSTGENNASGTGNWLSDAGKSIGLESADIGTSAAETSVSFEGGGVMKNDDGLMKTSK